MLVAESTQLSVARRATAAGARIASRYFSDLDSAAIQNKNDQAGYQGIVTKADVESEQAIIETIRKEYPGHQFLAEEEHTSQEGAEHLWIIDPLDGTNNFAHGIPHYAVSVGYYVDGDARCGCIISPESGDEFIVERGRGAWHNGKRASVNQHSSLRETMLAVGFYYDRGAMMQATLAAIDELFHQQIHGIRRMGTAALDICQVALGRFGGYFEYQLSPWDFAAAQLFLEEAGVKITTCSGEKLPLEKTSVLATNTLLHESLLAIVRKHADYLAK